MPALSIARVAVGILAVGTSVCGCGDWRGGEGAIPKAEQQAEALSLPPQWTFEPDSGDRRQVPDLLGSLASRLGTSDGARVAMVFRFGQVGAARRYLVITSIAPPEHSAIRRLALFALGDTTALSSVSEAFPFAADAFGTYRVLSLEDRDGDQLPDASLCVWGSERATRGVAHVVGYRRGSWYDIRPSTSDRRECASIPPDEP